MRIAGILLAAALLTVFAMYCALQWVVYLLMGRGAISFVWLALAAGAIVAAVSVVVLGGPRDDPVDE